MSIKDFLLNKLGVVTKDYHKNRIEEMRNSFEKWAVKNLTGKNGEVTPDCSHYLPFSGDDIVVIRSQISISGAMVNSLKIAPWCKDVSVFDIVTK